MNMLTLPPPPFEKGRLGIKKVKFANKNKMIDHPDLFQIDHSMWLWGHQYQEPQVGWR